MSDRDFNNYEALFHEANYYLRPPDLLIVESIPTRPADSAKGREYGPIDYLERLNNLYEEWITRYPYEKLIIDTDDLDFVNDKEDLGNIIGLLNRTLRSI